MGDLQDVTIIERNTGSIVETAHGRFLSGFSPVEDSQSTDKVEIKRLRSKHCDYTNNEAHWRFLLRSYEGGPHYVCGDTLFRHQREQADDFQDRMNRANYQNYCQPLVDFVPEFIYMQEIDREPNAEVATQFEVFRKNVDRAGTPLKVFMQQLAETSRIFGHSFVQVDKKQIPSELEGSIVSQKQAEDYGLDTPYFIAVTPLEVLDWRTDTEGNFIYLKRVQFMTESTTDQESYIDVELYSEWWVDRRRISRIDVTDPKNPKLLRFSGKAPTEAHTWGVVPFVPVFNRRSKSNRDLGISFLQDIAYQNRQVFNLSSLIDEFLYRQCFNILSMERDTAVPFAEQVEGNIGTNNVLDIPREAKHRPEYLSPPADPAEFIQGERENAIKEMYRQASQDIMHELFARSGDAIKQGFARAIPVIAKAADILEAAEQQMFGMWAKLMGKQWTGKIAYKDDYSITQLQDLLLQLSTIFNNLHVLPPTFVREEWKRVIREFDGKLDANVMQDIINEINDMSDDDLLLPFQMANDTQAAFGVPSTANMIQGKDQKALGTDKNRTMKTGDKSATKEAAPDANKRATRGRAQSK